MRLASTASLKSSPSPSKAHGRSWVAMAMACLVRPSEQAILQDAVGRLVDDLHRALGNGHHRDNRGDCRRFEAGEGSPGGQFFKTHVTFLFVMRQTIVLPSQLPAVSV